MCSPAFWRESHTVGHLKLLTGCCEPNRPSSDSGWHHSTLEGPELADQTVSLSQQNKTQREHQGGTKLSWDKRHFIFFALSFLFLYYYFCLSFFHISNFSLSFSYSIFSFFSCFLLYNYFLIFYLFSSFSFFLFIIFSFLFSFMLFFCPPHATPQKA